MRFMSLLLVAIIIVSASAAAQAQPTGTPGGFQLQGNWGTFQTAVSQCSRQFSAQPPLANYSNPFARLQIQQLCSGFGCWVDGDVVTNAANQTLCPFVYFPAGASAAPTAVQHASCTSFQRFACTAAAAISSLPPPLSPRPSPLPTYPPTYPSSYPPSPSPNIDPPSYPPSPRPKVDPAASQGSSPSPSTDEEDTYPPDPPSPPEDPPNPPSPASPSPPASQLPQQPPPQESADSNYELLSQLSMVVAVHMVHIPGTDRYLYMERPSGYHPDNSRFIAGSLDVVTRTWKHLTSPDGLFCCGHTLMSNGSVAIVGGHVANAGWPSGIQSIRTYTDGEPGLVKSTSMRYPRWYPTATLLPNSKIMIMGGTQGVGAGTTPNPYYEIWDPDTPDFTQQFLVERTYLTAVKQNYYPFNYVLPNGDMFNWCSRSGWIMDPYTGTYKVKLPSRPSSKVNPGGVYTTQFPYTGTSVMLALRPQANYSVEVMQFGGADVRANANLALLGCSESLRLRVHLPPAGRVYSSAYTFNGGWEQEDMGSPRVMPDAVLLPNGIVILMSGAKAGLAGDAASGGGSRSSLPNFFAEAYDPDAPAGQRWSTLARSQLARLYHSTAALTTNGTILVSGCDRCSKIVADLPFSLPKAKAEYRSEIFYPPYWFNFWLKPSIVSAPESVTYGQRFSIAYTGEEDPNVQVTSVVLVAPSSVTHSFNMNQRVIELVATVDLYSQTIQATAPPTRNHAPPQLYMMFLLNGNTYSKAVWVALG